MLSRRLERKGFETMIAVDGKQGVEMAQSSLPDLILMDMSLPVMDGWEATRLLKQNSLTSKIPIVGLSAHAMAGDREKAISVGCDEYETKPVDLNGLVSKIEALTSRAPEHESK